MERHLIPHWICLVQAESQGNTSKTVEQSNLTTNYGIFQVKDFHKFFIYCFMVSRMCLHVVWCRLTAKSGAEKIRKLEIVTSNAQVNRPFDGLITLEYEIWYANRYE